MPNAIREPGCIFCDIVAGEADRSVVYEDHDVVAFMDVHPAAPGHLLVAPKRHATHLADLSPDSGAALMNAATACAEALRASALRSDGINLVVSDGAAAGQEVLHIHMHVLPRFPGDGFVIRGTYADPPDRATLHDQAQTIAQHLEQRQRFDRSS